MDDELKHYGVVGMKWGVRKNPSKAYARASKKLTRLDAKVTKQGAKVSKRVEKYNKSKYGWSLRDPKQEKWKVGRAQYKYEKRVRKAAKWVAQMEKEFTKTDNIKLSSAQIDKGKKYTEILAKREESRAEQLY